MSARTRILFVDDEPHVLNGLRRMLRPMRDVWDVTFAEGGSEAVAQLSNTEFEVVVTDMQMPGMSGAELLATASDLQPSAVRIVLSGQAREGDLLDAVNRAHQFLAKPCEPETLKSAIERASALRQELTDPDVVGVLSQVAKLPSFPTAYSDITAIMRTDDPSIERVGKIIASDPAMSAKVLQLTNSSFFGLSRTIGDPVQATAMLGLQHILELVLGTHLARELGSAALDVDYMSKRSDTLSFNARHIALELGLPAAQAAFARAAGTLAMAGPLILSCEFPDAYQRLIHEADGRHLPDSAAELANFGVTSDQATAYLLELWGLPPTIIEAIAFHRNPSALPQGLEPFTVVALHLAAALDESHEPSLDLDAVVVERLGLADRVEQWREYANSAHGASVS